MSVDGGEVRLSRTMTHHKSTHRTNPGRRWFVAGGVALILFGAVHLLAVYKTLVVGPTEPAEIALTNQLKAFQTTIGPFKPSAWHTMNILNCSYSVLLIFAGVLDLLSAGPAAAADRLRPLTLANVIFTFLIAAICLAFQFPPPLVFAGAAWFCFTLSLIKQIARPSGILAGSSVYPGEGGR